MSRKKRRNRNTLRARDKVLTKMSKDGAVEQNVTIGTEKRISKRDVSFNLRKADSQADYGSSSLVGTRFGGRGIGNADGKSSKKKSRRILRKNALSENKSAAEVPPSKPVPANVSDIPENNITPNKSPFRAEAAVYSFPTKSEHVTQGRIRRTSQRPKPLTKYRLFGMRQSPKPKLQKQRQNQQYSQPEIELDSVTATENVLPQEDIPPHQPRSPTVKPIATKKKQLRHSRQDANLQHVIANGRYEQNANFSTDEKSPDSAPVNKNQQLKHADTADDRRSAADSSNDNHNAGNSEQPDTPKPRKISKLEHRVEKTSGKLDSAKNYLPAKHKLRTENTVDEVSGKTKTRLTFDKETISQREHLKGALPLRPVKFAANTAIAKAHVKIFQVEDENVGVKAAHKVELAGEGAIRSALRHRKLTPYKKAAKLERQLSNRSAKLNYQRALHENPKLKKNPIARMWQKRKIKRRHAKAAREAQQATAKAQKAASFTGRAMKTVAFLIKRNPKVIITVVVLFVLVNIVSSLIGMLSGLGGSGAGAVFATTYLADEQEIEAVSLAYNDWEMDLQMEILNAEQNHPGFDEYRFNTGEISHSPFELMTYLTATRHIFTFAGAEPDLRALFDEQYQLSFTPSIEIRYRQETDADGNPIIVPYEWHVMTVILTARNFADVIFDRMNTGQRQHFDMLMQTRGQRQIVGTPFSFSWQSFITSEYGHRIHPISGSRDLHRGIDIGVPLGTEILAGFDGTVTFAGVSGGYGNIVIIQGENGLEARYAHMHTIGVSVAQSVSLGDVIGTVGNTGVSTGAHLHLEVLRNGQFLNPIFFTDMGEIDPSNPPLNNNPPRLPMGEGTFEDLLMIGESVLSAPYVWGGSGPNVFDCSGLVVWLFNQAGIAEVPRTTAQGLFNLSSPVSASEAQPGDLIFFQGTFSSPRTITHIGVYTGNGIMLHTGGSAGVEFTSINSPFWQRHFFAFGRLS